MRLALACLTAMLMLAGCSKTSTGSTSGVFTADGKQTAFTDVTAQPLTIDGKQIFIDGQPEMSLVFTAQPQGGERDGGKAADDGRYGDAMVIEMNGSSVTGAGVRLSGLGQAGSVSIDAPLTLKNYSSAGGQISGELTSGGPVDVSGHQVNIDLTFHTKAL